MAGLKDIEGYDDSVVNICPNDTEGEIIEISGIDIQLPKKPGKKDILFSDKKKSDQHWQRIPIPEDLSKIRSMDEWAEQPKEFRLRYNTYIEKEFERRSNGVWFMNDGVATYITGRHYMMLQWSKIDIGYAYYLEFQRRLFLHFSACESDPRSLGQIYTKCRRSGYTNISSTILVNSVIGFADQIQLTHLKIQQAIAKAKPDGLIVDIEGLENVQLGRGGELQPLDIQDIYEQTGVFYYRSKNPEGGFQNL